MTQPQLLDLSAQDSLASLTGLQFVQGLFEGRIPRPPMANTLPFTLLEPREGHVELLATAERRFYNPMQMAHGGWIMTLLDTAMGLAAQTTLAPGEICPSHETSVKFVRPILTDTGEVRVIGEVISRGRSVITLDGRIEDAAGRIHAHGTSTCIIPGRAAR